MYSLGVIFLEMNVPFATGMERAETLEPLQKGDRTLPPALDVPEKATQAKIFTVLVEHQPSQRPGSAELLNSGQVPAENEDESFRIARRLLNDRDSHFRSQFISTLFAEGHLDSASSGSVTSNVTNPMRAVTLLEDVKAMSRSLPNDLDLQALVKQRLTSIFHRHGAVERTDNPALFPYHSCYTSTDVVQLLHPNGKILQMPYDLILPNAMLLAGQARQEQKTFIFDNVYRVDHSRDRPRIFGEVNFDIVSSHSFDLVLGEAEVLKVVDEILEAFPSLASLQMCYHINHSLLLDAVLRFCDIESFKFPVVKETLSKLHTGDWSWAKVRHELRAPTIAVAATSLDELERFDFRDTWENAIPKIRSLLKDTVDLESSFAHMKAVILYLFRFNIRRKIYVNPLSTYNEKFYRGSLLFQCLYDQKKRSVFAAGGRYDRLVRDHQPITSKKTCVHAAGLQLAWTGLCAGLMGFLKAQAKSRSRRKPQHLAEIWSTRRCDVLIDSFDRELISSVGIEIVQELWANHISAELAGSENSVSAENTYTKHKSISDHNWIILIKSEDLVKIKCSTRKEENEVRTSEITGFLRSEIRDRNRTEGRTNRTSVLRQDSQQDPAGREKAREVDIKVLTSQNKGKKVNRKTVVGEGET